MLSQGLYSISQCIEVYLKTSPRHASGSAVAYGGDPQDRAASLATTEGTSLRVSPPETLR
ncbi:MAG: hypothetical protein AAF349_18200 [Cyanobacteria bacterium P01_A01_bin.68]